MIWTRDFDPNSVMEIPEYFVYCGIFITQSWSKRSVQIAKREFLEVPNNLPDQYSKQKGICLYYRDIGFSYQHHYLWLRKHRMARFAHILQRQIFLL